MATFVSAANAVALRGATPVIVDIHSTTLNLDEGLIEAAITDRTRAMIFVEHYAGVACEMDPICSLAEKYGLKVVEDERWVQRAIAFACGCAWRRTTS